MASKPKCFEVETLKKEDVHAIKAVYAGEADPYQQRRAMFIFVNHFCRTHDVLFVPGEPDQTTFLNGRAFPGMQLLKTLNQPIGKLIDSEG